MMQKRKLRFEMMQRDPEFARLSSRKAGELIGVSHPLQFKDGAGVHHFQQGSSIILLFVPSKTVWNYTNMT